MTFRQWVNKPTDELISLMNQSVDLEMFLVQENGPLSFTFRTENNTKITTTIGDFIKCSCQLDKKFNKTNEISKHCVHSIYVLNRIFKLNFSNKLMFQAKFTESELNKLVSMRVEKYKDKGKVVENEELEKKVKYIKKKKNGLKEISLVDDTSCAICQEDMYFEEGLFTCSSTCGRHYHIRCLTIWVSHKITVRENISCPMCRSKLSEEDLVKHKIISYNNCGLPVANKVIKNNSKNIFIVHKDINCKNCCRQNIKYERFHCLLCEQYDLCVECFIYLKEQNLHDANHVFIVKKAEKEKWYGVINDFSFGSMIVDKSGNTVRYSTENIRLTQFICNLLKSVDKKELENLNEKKIDLIENNLVNNEPSNSENLEISSNNHVFDNKIINKCVNCNSAQSSKLYLYIMKSLPCNHNIHVKCSEIIFEIKEKGNQMIVSSNFNFCSSCNKFIYIGLESIGLIKNIKDKDNTIIKQKQSNSKLTINTINNNKQYSSSNIDIKSIKNNRLVPITQVRKLKEVKFDDLSDMLFVEKLNFNANNQNNFKIQFDFNNNINTKREYDFKKFEKTNKIPARLPSLTPNHNSGLRLDSKSQVKVKTINYLDLNTKFSPLLDN
jgi:hypothetical protein